MKNKKKTCIIIIAVAVIIILIIAGITGKKDNTPVTAEKIKLNNITEVIPANGKIQPVIEVKISPDVSGEIVELNFKEGDKVKRGDLIIKIKQPETLDKEEILKALGFDSSWISVTKRNG